MENDARIRRQNVITIIMNVVIVFLVVITLICGGLMIEELSYVFSDPHSKREMSYCIQYGDYHTLVTRYHENMAAGVEGNSEMKEYYGVAKYVEAASYYKVFLEAGDTARAEQEKAKMEQALAEMGGWSILQDEIDGKLGIND